MTEWWAVPSPEERRWYRIFWALWIAGVVLLAVGVVTGSVTLPLVAVGVFAASLGANVQWGRTMRRRHAENRAQMAREFDKLVEGL
jgi:Flp pilus assembly protein TadB